MDQEPQDGSCFECVRKHLCKAMINFTEVHTGHPEKWFNVIGNLAESEEEVWERHLEFAMAIREWRLAFESDTTVKPPFAAFLEFNEVLIAAFNNEDVDVLPALPDELKLQQPEPESGDSDDDDLPF